MEKKWRNRSNDDMSFINDNKKDPILEADNDEEMLQQMYVFEICHIIMCLYVYAR